MTGALFVKRAGRDREWCCCTAACCPVSCAGASSCYGLVVPGGTVRSCACVPLLAEPARRRGLPHGPGAGASTPEEYPEHANCRP
jgi:hypothetical protein